MKKLKSEKKGKPLPKPKVLTSEQRRAKADKDRSQKKSHANLQNCSPETKRYDTTQSILGKNNYCKEQAEASVRRRAILRRREIQMIEDEKRRREWELTQAALAQHESGTEAKAEVITLSEPTSAEFAHV